MEDHYAAGGLGEAVLSALVAAPAAAAAAAATLTATRGGEAAPVIHIMAVRRKPMSGAPAELRDYEEISADAIVRKVKETLGR